MTYTRRDWLKAAAVSGAGLLALRANPLAALVPKETPITVYKTAACGCCKGWVEHLKKNGFAVTTHDLPDLAETKASLGVPSDLQSCHTGVMGKYFIEGHVPADVILNVWRTQPKDLLGLAVPGMPVGSPGMEQGAQKDSYNVVGVLRSGKRSVYARR